MTNWLEPAATPTQPLWPEPVPMPMQTSKTRKFVALGVVALLSLESPFSPPDVVVLRPRDAG